MADGRWRIDKAQGSRMRHEADERVGRHCSSYGFNVDFDDGFLVDIDAVALQRRAFVMTMSASSRVASPSGVGSNCVTSPNSDGVAPHRSMVSDTTWR
ncbi:MAG: hypothetical protein HY314_17425 [Acidobacteria bacterium]|nr:hypothetical protein [Acidobacteriota bacterium]